MQTFKYVQPKNLSDAAGISEKDGDAAVLFAGGLASPGVLTAVKGTELGELALSTIPKVLPKLGFA